MSAVPVLAVLALVVGLSGYGQLQGDDRNNKAMVQTDAIRIVLNAEQPDLSKGVLYEA